MQVHLFWRMLCPHGSSGQGHCLPVNATPTPTSTLACLLQAGMATTVRSGAQPPISLCQVRACSARTACHQQEAGGSTEMGSLCQTAVCIPLPPAGREVQRPWIAEHVHTPAAQDFPPGATRKRPLIYM
jgi:hypothetical protein